MRKQLAAITAAITLGVAATATPAYATVWHNCPEDHICFYQWINYGAPSGAANPGWKSTFYNLSIHTNGCVNLLSPAAYWPNGTQVWDNEGSMVINGSGAYSANVGVSIYPWSNCNSGGGIASWPADRPTLYNDMRLIQVNATQTAYHNIESVNIHTP